MNLESGFPGGLSAIREILTEAAHDDAQYRSKCLENARPGLGLTLREAASLLAAPSDWNNRIFDAAAQVNLARNGRCVSFYGVVYIHDHCVNECVYCGDNRRICFPRKVLSKSELLSDVSQLTSKHSFREICFLTGEAPDRFGTPELVEYLQAVVEIYKGKVILNIPPLSVEEFRLIRQALPATKLQFRVFQETYDAEAYGVGHVAGPKRDMVGRMDAQRRALDAGFDEVGFGVLYGLNGEPWGAEFDTLAVLAHAFHLNTRYGECSNTVSFPRIRPIPGAQYQVPNPVSDERLARCIAMVKLAMPSINTVLTCREKAEFRRALRPVINIEDYAARPGPGGNSAAQVRTQMLLLDMRSGDLVKEEMVNDGYAVG